MLGSEYGSASITHSDPNTMAVILQITFAIAFNCLSGCGSI